MATALVVRTQRYKKIGDKTSPLVYTLKRKPRDAKMYDLKRIAEEIEALGGMSAEDVLHVGKAIVRNMREKLTDGNSVRLDDLRLVNDSVATTKGAANNVSFELVSADGSTAPGGNGGGGNTGGEEENPLG